MDVRKFNTGKRLRKVHKDINFSPRFDHSFYKRAPRYNPRVLIGNWYEEANGLMNIECHRQTEYQRQFSTKVIPRLNRLNRNGNIGKQFDDDPYKSTYDVSYKIAPNIQKNYNHFDSSMESLNQVNHGDNDYFEE